jgi:hypothetical protein
MSYMNRTSMLDEMLGRMSHHEPNTAFDFPKNEAGMTLQRRDGTYWVNYKVDGKVVKSPVDLESLPAGKYRLV